MTSRSPDTMTNELMALSQAGLEAAVRECARITAPEIGDAEFSRIKADNSPRYRNTVSDVERVIRSYLAATQAGAEVGVRDLASFLLDAPAQSAIEMARALLAEYSITKRGK